MARPPAQQYPPAQPMFSTPASIAAEQSGLLNNSGSVGGAPLSPSMNNAIAGELMAMNTAPSDPYASFSDIAPPAPVQAPADPYAGFSDVAAPSAPSDPYAAFSDIAGSAPSLGQFDTKLSPTQEQAFQQWKSVNTPNDSGRDYDLRGAFLDNLTRADNGHFSDKFKKPNHPTFSDQSIYANTPGAKPGTWNGDTYIPYQSAAPAAVTRPANESMGNVALQSLVRGALTGGKEFAQGAQAITSGLKDIPTEPAAKPNSDYTGQLLNQGFLDGGYKNPDWYVAHLVNAGAQASPTLATGAAGTLAGGAIGARVAGEPGAAAGGIAGGMAGFGAGSAMQAITRSYQTAIADGLPHDQAVDRAIKEAETSGTIGMLMGVAPEFKLFGTEMRPVITKGVEQIAKVAKRPISEALAQIFGVQPAIGAAGQVAAANIENKPITPEQLATGYVENVGLGAGMTAAHGLVRAVRGPDKQTIIPPSMQGNEGPTRATPPVYEHPPQPEGPSGQALTLPAPAAAEPTASPIEPVAATAGPVSESPKPIILPNEPISTKPAEITPPETPQNIPAKTIQPGENILPSNPAPSEIKGLPVGSVNPGDQVTWQGNDYQVESLSPDGISARLKTDNPRMSLDIPLTELSGRRASTLEVPKIPENGISSTSNVPSFRSDIPNENWLAVKQKHANEDILKNKGQGLSGKGLMGSVTGSFEKPTELPVEALSQIPGAMGEENIRTQSEKMLPLVKSMQKTGFDKTQPPLIGVNHKGEAFVIEGNHRIAAAKAVGIKNIPVEVRYFNGGELAQGNLSPDKVHSLSTPAGELLKEAAPLESTKNTRKPIEPGKPEEVAKTGGAGFEHFATNRDININKKVFEDIGLNPDEAVQLAPVKQREHIVNAFDKKFGIKVIFDQKLNIKDQIDQLADMYVGMNNMAFSLGLPARAMSLDGTISLEISGKRPYLGVYDPNINRITIPNKSNSFAHEWLHALDHFLIKKYGPISDKLFSGAIRKEGFDAKNPLQQSFVKLLNSLFFDKAKLAAKVIELENTAAHGKTESARAEAQATLDEIAAGNYKGINVKGDYFAAAKTVGSDVAYWTKPEEMMARAVEAYIGWKLENVGATSKGVSKKNVAYESNADHRLATAFPKLEDRNHIFDSLDEFFARLGEAGIMGEDAHNVSLMEDPHFLGILDPRFWEKPGAQKENLGWLRSTINKVWDGVRQDYKDSKIRKENLRREKEQQAEINELLNPSGKGLKGVWNRFHVRDVPGVTLWNHMWSTERTQAHSIEKKYPSIQAIRMLNDRIFTRPGDASPMPAVYNQKIATSVNQASKVMERIMQKHFPNMLTLEERDQLRNAFLGMDVTPVKGSKITKENFVKAAADLRLMTDTAWKRMREAGFEVGYVSNGAWLRRHYITDRVMAAPNKFLEKAALTYKDQYDEAFGGVDGAIAKIDDFMDVVQGMLKADPEGLSFDKRLVQQIKDAIESKDLEKVKELIGGIYDEIGNQYARLAAQKWLGELVSGGNSPQFESAFPIPGFMKKRGLPVSADTHLKDFMETNVEKILFHYMVAANTAIAQKEVLNPKGAPSMAKLLEEARGQGMSKEDAQDLEDSINRIVHGPKIGPLAKRIGKVVTLMRTGAILMQLNKVVYSALSEPWVVGLKTRNVFNGFRAYADAITDLVGTKEAKYFREVADVIGAIGTDYADMMQSERLGGGFETGLLTRETMAKFFRYTGNTGITNIQSRAAIRAGYRWLSYLSNKLLNGSDSEKSMAKRDLAELGISGQNMAPAFAHWLIDNDGHPDLRKLNESDAVFTGIFTDAVVRFRDQAVQHPKKEDRPALANHPVGSVLYTGLGFTFSFWDNVVKAEAKKIADIAKNEGAGPAAWALSNHLMTIGCMLAMGYLVNALRMMQYDKDKYDELAAKDPDKLHMLLFGRSIDNTSLAGAAYSVLFNAYKATEYGRDLLTSASGLVISSYVNWLQKMIELSSRNSPNTTTQEHEAIKQTYRVIVAPLITGALLNLPGPKSLLGAPVGIASMYLNSNVTADAVANAMGYPKGKTAGAAPAKSSAADIMGNPVGKKAVKTDLMGNPIAKKSHQTDIMGNPISKKK